MNHTTLKFRDSSKTPFNYLLYPVVEILAKDINQNEKTFPKEFSTHFNGFIKIQPPYKKIVEY